MTVPVFQPFVFVLWALSTAAKGTKPVNRPPTVEAVGSKRCKGKAAAKDKDLAMLVKQLENCRGVQLFLHIEIDRNAAAITRGYSRILNDVQEL